MKDNKKKIILSIIGILILIATFSLITYAWFSAKSKAEEHQITTGKLDLVVEIDNELSHIESMKPTTWSNNIDTNNSNSKIVQIPINVINKSTIDVLYSLTLTTENFTSLEDSSLTGGSLGDIKYILYSLDENKQIIMGDFIDLDYKQKIIDRKEIGTDVTEKYILYVYIENTNELQNKLQGLSFDVVINGEIVSNEINKKQMSLAETILSSEPIIEEEPNFTTKSRDRGLYKMNTSEGSIYYYRGSTTHGNIRQYYKMNNYVQFGTYKTTDGGNEIDTPILWRILRINEDNSITMITTKATSEKMKWDTAGINYVRDDKSDSDIKKIVDEWYNKNIYDAGLNDLVKTTEFCNDRNTERSVLSRLYNQVPQNPTLECIRSEDIVEAKAGLITADEIVYAGGLFIAIVENSNTTFLSGLEFWTMSPNISNKWPINWANVGWMTNNSLSGFESVARPVITINPDVAFTVNETISYAKGSEKNPYKIVAE